MEIKQKSTTRGFIYQEFKDRAGHVCTLQDSSVATDYCCWLGINDPDSQITARDVVKLGREDLLNPVGDPNRYVGWVKWPIPEDVLISTRMHLTQDQVKALLPYLQHFAEHGTVDIKKK